LAKTKEKGTTEGKRKRTTAKRTKERKKKTQQTFPVALFIRSNITINTKILGTDNMLIPGEDHIIHERKATV